MSDALNYYGRNAEIGEPYQTIWGYTYLGPVLVPPVPTTFGMLDRAGTGTYFYLMWDGEDHLLITDRPPRPFPVTLTTGQVVMMGQNTTLYGPWDGPYAGVTGWRLGVTTAAVVVNGVTYVGGQPRLQFDSPEDSAHGGYRSAGPDVIAPSIFGPQSQSYPESTGFPTSQPPSIPGIPSSSPVPQGGGLAAFLAAFTTNTPPMVLPAQVPVNSPPIWHLQHLGG